MGRSGPPPDNVRTLQLKGSNRARHRSEDDEVSAPVGDPVAPAWMNPFAKPYFDAWVQKFKDIGICSPVYSTGIAAISDCEYEIEQANLLIATHGHYILHQIGHGGGVKPIVNPAIAVKRDALARMQSLLDAHGFTPATASRVKRAKKPESEQAENPFAALARLAQSK